MVQKNYYELINGQLDSDNINFLLEDKRLSYKNDNRPVISRKVDLHSGSIYEEEKEKIIKSIEDNKKNIDKLMDKSLKEIIGETSDVTSNFLEDYNNEYIKTKKMLHIDDNSEDNSYMDIFKLYRHDIPLQVGMDIVNSYANISQLLSQGSILEKTLAFLSENKGVDIKVGGRRRKSIKRKVSRKKMRKTRKY